MDDNDDNQRRNHNGQRGGGQHHNGAPAGGKLSSHHPFLAAEVAPEAQQQRQDADAQKRGPQRLAQAPQRRLVDAAVAVAVAVRERRVEPEELRHRDSDRGKGQRRPQPREKGPFWVGPANVSAKATAAQGLSVPYRVTGGLWPRCLCCRAQSTETCPEPASTRACLRARPCPSSRHRAQPRGPVPRATADGRPRPVAGKSICATTCSPAWPGSPGPTHVARCPSSRRRWRRRPTVGWGALVRGLQIPCSGLGRVRPWPAWSAMGAEVVCERAHLEYLVDALARRPPPPTERDGPARRPARAALSALCRVAVAHGRRPRSIHPAFKLGSRRRSAVQGWERAPGSRRRR
ncbi:hypothetical protein G6O67_007253 [Ophiocordyceps sinensis]|uniref:Uncharacterized protein n=1 Tax=Ophiocordyceps sinensis TaxID=72228 RepID=A0A8H4LTS7_9HYPO|nr:hypothetical protein G6O67_007253 [Ophiocordyceps sinensis]